MSDIPPNLLIYIYKVVSHFSRPWFVETDQMGQSATSSRDWTCTLLLDKVCNTLVTKDVATNRRGRVDSYLLTKWTNLGR
jgi:hypothetical protein